MDELEKLKRAKDYIEKLARGIDPITDHEYPDDTVLNNIRLSRCFFYVADVLRQVVENGGITSPAIKSYKSKFHITEEQKNSIIVSTSECFMKDLIEKINEVAIPNNCKKLQHKLLNSWLVNKGFLEVYLDKANKNRKKATIMGENIGLRTEIRNSMYGAYPVTILNENAQRFILDNLDAIIQEVSSEINHQDIASQGAPWSADHEEMLIDLFNKKVPVYEIAVTLKRTEEGIRARLKKLGVIEHRSDAK